MVLSYTSFDLRFVHKCVCVLRLGFDHPHRINFALRGMCEAVSSMAITLHQLGHYEGHVREKEMERDKGEEQRKKDG